MERCVDGSWTECSVAAAPEDCDGDDDDCDGNIDEGLRIVCWPDADNDGFAAPEAVATESCPAMGRTGVGGCPPGQTDRDPAVELTDCDDRMAAIRPTAEERLNEVDDDCDGSVDEDTG